LSDLHFFVTPDNASLLSLQRGRSTRSISTHVSMVDGGWGRSQRSLTFRFKEEIYFPLEFQRISFTNAIMVYSS
jgi:S-adenosylmethionine hydrolase